MSKKLELHELSDALNTLEQDTKDVAKRFTEMLTSTKAVAKATTGSSMEHMRVLNHQCASVRSSADVAVDQLTAFMNRCLELDQQLGSLDSLQAKLNKAKELLTQLETLLGV